MVIHRWSRRLLASFGLYCALLAFGIWQFGIVDELKQLPLAGQLLVHFVSALAAGMLVGIAWLLFLSSKIRVFCEHCGKFIDKIMLWRCGMCDKVNGRNYPTSYLGPCTRCGELPHAIVCPHCEKLNFLDEQRIEKNPARSLCDAKPVAPAASPDEIHANEVKELERKKEIAVRAAALANAEGELERTRKALASSVERSLSERLEKNFETFRDRAMAVDAIAKRELKHAEEAYRDDPDMLEKMRLAIDSWHDENIQ